MGSMEICWPKVFSFTPQNGNIYLEVSLGFKIFIVIFDHDNSNIVSWIEADKNDGIIFISSPVNVDSYLRSTIFENQENIILTGATLTSFGTPQEFCKEIGIDNLGNYEIFDSEFDYKNNVLLSIPSNMPEPNDPNYNRSLVYPHVLV